VIEKALSEAKCVIVLWSSLSVNSEYVKQKQQKLWNKNNFPTNMEKVSPPAIFKRLYTLSLFGWEGSKDSRIFESLSQKSMPQLLVL
jgi:hypothetical protein